MESDKSEKRKRSLSTSVDEETDSKRFKAPTRELLSLSEDVLFLIFKYLSTAGELGNVNFYYPKHLKNY